jgi:hypothetical protein
MTTALSTNRSKNNRFSRLAFETLETRDCPAVISLQATMLGQHEVMLSGQVTDGAVSGMEIQISGAACASVFTESDGTFSLITDEASLGTVFAVGKENGVEITNTASAAIASDAPLIVFDYAQWMPGDTWTIVGHVTDEDAAGLTVQFGGVLSNTMTVTTVMFIDGEEVTFTTTMEVGPPYTAVVQEDGSFTLTVYIDYLQSQTGWVTATTTDCWGIESNLAITNLM